MLPPAPLRCPGCDLTWIFSPHVCSSPNPTLHFPAFSSSEGGFLLPKALRAINCPAVPREWLTLTRVHAAPPSLQGRTPNNPVERNGIKVRAAPWATKTASSPWRAPNSPGLGWVGGGTRKSWRIGRKRRRREFGKQGHKGSWLLPQMRSGVCRRDAGDAVDPFLSQESQGSRGSSALPGGFVPPSEAQPGQGVAVAPQEGTGDRGHRDSPRAPHKTPNKPCSRQCP